jgi:hypothetical protein
MRKVAFALVVIGCGGSLATGLDDASPGDGGSDVLDGSNDVTPVDSPFDDVTFGIPCRCSGDLHSVLDCKGNVIQTCALDQGCAGNLCQPACTASDSGLIGGKFYAGCDFYSVVPDVLPNNQLEGGCYAVEITNEWTTAMTVTVDRAGSTLPAALYAPSGSGSAMTFASITQVDPGKTALLFLAGVPNAKPSCPTGVVPAITTDPAIHGTDLGSAFHIVTSMPATAADYVPFGASAYIASASVLIPTHSWGTNYILVDGYVASQISGGVPSTDIVALQDGTQVWIDPVADIVASNTVQGTPATKPKQYALSKGQVLQFTQNADLTGSAIQSNYPIGLWGAHTCMNIDPTTGYCDSGHQQLRSVNDLGWDYAAVRYKNRTSTDETPPWRIVGVVNGTTLTFDPPVSGAPATINSGQVVTFTAAGPFRVTSQSNTHPFYISAHMTGGSSYNSLGDPEFVNVMPARSWRSAYTFFTQPGFPETSLVVVRSSANGGFKDVKLDCAGTLTGWTAIDAAGMYQYARLDLSTGSFTGQNGCDNGAHAATSAGPFTVTTWGWGNAPTNTYSVSYALPSGF